MWFDDIYNLFLEIHIIEHTINATVWKHSKNLFLIYQIDNKMWHMHT